VIAARRLRRAERDAGAGARLAERSIVKRRAVERATFR
jgi:hypothetical protein